MVGDSLGSSCTVNNDILEEGKKRLTQIELDHNIEILWAVESGSRAWGFASTDSDYDIRFIYRHPRDWYLSVKENRDVIEPPIADLWDMSGWDIRKSLRLALKSNPTLHEWLASPIVYMGNEAFHRELRQIVQESFGIGTLLHHYCSMAVTQLRRMQGGDEVKLKSYFYGYRPVLALQWICREQTLPPIDLPTLKASGDMPSDVAATLEDLLAQKLDSQETAYGPRHLEVESWIWAEVSKAEAKAKEMSDQGPDIAVIDAFFREWARL